MLADAGYPAADARISPEVRRPGHYAHTTSLALVGLGRCRQVADDARSPSAVGSAELAEHLRDVSGDGALGDEEALTDLPVAQALDEERRDLLLAARQVCDGPGGGAVQGWAPSDGRERGVDHPQPAVTFHRDESPTGGEEVLGGLVPVGLGATGE